MTTQNIGLMKAIGARMDYLNERQRIISQNIANADTPNYRPKDLKPIDFSSVLKGLDNNGGLRLAAPSSGHTASGLGGGDVPAAKTGEMEDIYEVTPTGNAVVVEEQLMAASQNVADYNLMTSLYQKQVRLMNIALGRN